MHGIWRSLTCLLVGAGFGVLDSVVNRASFVADPTAITTGRQVARYLSYLLDAGWAWAAMAVLAGWWARTWGLAAVAGWLSVSGAVVGYYVTDAQLRREPFALHTAELFLWLGACSLLCAPLGLVGAWSRRRGRVALRAGLVVPVGAAVQTLVLPPGLDGAIVHPEAVWARWTVWTAAAVSALLLVGRRRRSTARRGTGAAAL